MVAGLRTHYGCAITLELLRNSHIESYGSIVSLARARETMQIHFVKFANPATVRKKDL